MRGMGWKEGMSVGKNAPKEVSGKAACCFGLRTIVPPNFTQLEGCQHVIYPGAWQGCDVDYPFELQEVKAKEYVARPSMLGLGAKPSEILQRPPKQHIRQVGHLL